MRSLVLAALVPLLSVPALATAAESDFLKSLAGNWKGTGTVLTNIGSKPMNVSCGFNVNSSPSSLSMNGTCRGLLVVQRAISADLKVNGQRYGGTYVGPAGLPSMLSGRRQGDTVNLAVRWAKPVNGDRDANMTIEKRGTNGLRLQTVDRDPSGKSVVTSRIDLTRS